MDRASVLELAGLIAARDLSPVELVDDCIRRIELQNPGLNAITTLLLDEARAEARQSAERIAHGRPLGRLEGIPIPVKENVFLRGTGLTMASRLGVDVPLDLDAELVGRLRGAGAVFPGKTNMPEFGTLGRSESRRFGVARNPWDLERTPGGSSGGAGAAVAAGMVPAAHGNDGGGSLRIPAACNGLYTLKVSRGRVTRAPLTDVTGLVSEGFLTHTVADNALLLDLIDGYLHGEPYWSPPKQRPYIEEVGADPGRLRVGWTLTPPIDVPVDSACAAAVVAGARLLEQLGHQVEEVTLDWRTEDTMAMFLRLWAPSIAYGMDLLAEFGQDPQGAEPHNVALWEMAQGISSSQYLVALTRITEVGKRVYETWRDFDVVLTPALAQPPVPAGELEAQWSPDPLGPLHADERFTPFTSMFNITGQPAAAIPWDVEGGLPVGLQLVGRLGEEDVLLRLCSQVEGARPWRGRRPTTSAGAGR